MSDGRQSELALFSKAASREAVPPQEFSLQIAQTLAAARTREGRSFKDLIGARYDQQQVRLEKSQIDRISQWWENNFCGSVLMVGYAVESVRASQPATVVEGLDPRWFTVADGVKQLDMGGMLQGVAEGVVDCVNRTSVRFAVKEQLPSDVYRLIGWVIGESLNADVLSLGSTESVKALAERLGTTPEDLVAIMALNPKLEVDEKK